MDHPFIEKAALLNQLHELTVKARSEDGHVSEASQRELAAVLLDLLTHGIARRPFIARCQGADEFAVPEQQARSSSWEQLLNYLEPANGPSEPLKSYQPEEMTQRELQCIGTLQRWLIAQLRDRQLSSILNKKFSNSQSDDDKISTLYHPWAAMRVPFDRQRLLDDVKTIERLEWQHKRKSVTWNRTPKGSPMIQPRLLFAQNNIQLLQYTHFNEITSPTKRDADSDVRHVEIAGTEDRAQSTFASHSGQDSMTTRVDSSGYLCVTPADKLITCDKRDTTVNTSSERSYLSALPEVLLSEGPHNSLELAWWSNDVMSHERLQSSEPGSLELPEGWDAGYDPATGATYYINHAEQTTTWEHPALVALQQQPASPTHHRSLRLTISQRFPVLIHVRRDDPSTATPSATSSATTTPMRSRGSHADLVAIATGSSLANSDTPASGFASAGSSPRFNPISEPTIAITTPSPGAQTSPVTGVAHSRKASAVAATSSTQSSHSRGSGSRPASRSSILPASETDAGHVTLTVMHTIQLADGNVFIDNEPSEVVELYLRRGLQSFVGALRRCPHCTLQATSDWQWSLEDGVSPQQELVHARRISRTAAYGQRASRPYNWDKKASRPSEVAVSEEALQSFLADNGSIDDWPGLKKLIFFKGLRPSLRQQVWPWLLQVLDPQASARERNTQAQVMRESYHKLKSDWAGRDATDAALFKMMKDIIKDTARTDRGFEMFVDNSSEWLHAMLDVLMTYSSQYDKPYCQGMSDVLAPLLCILQDEAIAYHCFVKLLVKFEDAFDEAGLGVHLQLDLLRSLVELLLPDVYNVLCAHDLIQMFFAYRWIVLSFKREFALEQICDMWETVWCDHRTTNFTLFVAVAVLDLNQRSIVDKDWQSHELMEHLTSLPEGMNLKHLLARARQLLYRALSLDLPDMLREILIPFRSISSSNVAAVLQDAEAMVASPTSSVLLDAAHTNEVSSDQEHCVFEIAEANMPVHSAWQGLLELSHDYNNGEIRERAFGLYRQFSQGLAYRGALVQLADDMFEQAKQTKEPPPPLLRLLDCLLRLAELTKT
eukprot:TRINITY_DN9191_c0_g1_i1.p1 TRINITY_DN9191_c0_g1~~TRINITY_DN9191_c0_g1_i1.p1  ORF type:complete len:1061 (+),score=148.88 TRINITY_DN9191_c0_g1_i1:97-3279(+)